LETEEKTLIVSVKVDEKERELGEIAGSSSMRPMVFICIVGRVA
jgi:hypothetical protein